MTVTDPIFPSLWDATLSELGGETDVWEIFGDAPNFLAGASPETQADEAESVLRRLRAEGWARLSRRPPGAAPDAAATPLSDEEVKDAVRRVRAWFLTEMDGRHQVPEHVLGVFLEPTEQWLRWSEQRSTP